jgi:hypothetical protein
LPCPAYSMDTTTNRLPASNRPWCKLPYQMRSLWGMPTRALAFLAE